MSEIRSNNNWQNWLIGAMGTLLLSVSSMYMSNLNAQAKDTASTVMIVQTNQSIIRERLATVEEAVKQINELKASIEKLTDAVNEANKRNSRPSYQ